MMGRGYWLVHLLLMCTLDTKLNALIVTIRRVTPAQGDQVLAGNVVELQCRTRGSRYSFYIEWTRFVIMEGQEVSIASNGMSLDSRYTLIRYQMRMEILVFNATKEDTGVTYGCRLRDYITSIILDESHPGIAFTVLYFPSAMYPKCNPDGPVTVQDGTALHMRCTTELGNPPVQMQILTSSVVDYEWTYCKDSKEQMSSLQLNVTAANDGGSYECNIAPHSNSTPFTGMERSCTMGPISVVPMTTPQELIPSEEPTSTDSRRNMTCESSLQPTNVVGTPWLVAFLFIVSLIINIFLLIKHRHLKIAKKEKETIADKADPYMELQPNEDKNRVNMEPTMNTNDTQDAYYQPVEVETDSPDYDYARPDGLKEQRMNHQVSMHFEPTPSSETTDIQHTYYIPRVEVTADNPYDYAQPEVSTNTSSEVVSLNI